MPSCPRLSPSPFPSRRPSSFPLQSPRTSCPCSHRKKPVDSRISHPVPPQTDSSRPPEPPLTPPSHPPSPLPLPVSPRAIPSSSLHPAASRRGRPRQGRGWRGSAPEATGVEDAPPRQGRRLTPDATRPFLVPPLPPHPLLCVRQDRTPSLPSIHP